MIGSLVVRRRCAPRRRARSCCARRRSAEAIALAAGLAITEITMQIIKARGRAPAARGPAGRTPSGFSYPSGHAALSVTYLAIAVLLARGARRTAHRAGARRALALAVAIGLSRVYLRVHYLSDVGGGWAARPGRLLPLRSRRPRRATICVNNCGGSPPRPPPQPGGPAQSWTASRSPTSSSRAAGRGRLRRASPC